uniref:Gustatory receptor n=1 Tax=Anopheles christyi TaxID=43041 RepID=A0A182JXJ1_9DIPT
MDPKGVLSFWEKCCIWLLMVCGVLPLHYNATTNRFVKSAFHYWGCIVGIGMYAVLGPWLYWVTVTRVIHPKTQLNYYMMVMQFLFMYIVILTSRLKTLSNRERLCQLLNSLLVLREQVLQGSSMVAFQPGLTRRLLLKLIIFDLGMMVLSASFFRTFVEQKQSLLYSLLGFCNLLQVSSMNVAITLLLFVLYNGVNIYLLINARCNELVHGTKAPKDIVRLYLMHAEASLVVQSIVEVVSIPLLLLSIWYFFIIVFSVSTSRYLDAMLVDIMMQVLSLYTFEEHGYVRTDSVHFVSSLMFYAMMYFVAVIENFILFGVLVCGVMQEMINIIMKRLARSWQGRPKQGSSIGGPSVLNMYLLHCQNEDMVKKLMETLNFPTLMLTGWYFFMIVYSVYYMYVFAFEASQRGIKLDQFKTYFNPLIFFLYQCLQLYLLVLIPSTYTDHAKKMMRLLNYVTANQYQYRPAEERLHERLANVFLVSILIVAQLSFIYLFMIMANVTMLINAEMLASTLNALFAVRNVIQQQWSCPVPRREYAKLLVYKILFIDIALLLFSLIMFYATQEKLPNKEDLAVGVYFFVFRNIITALVNLYLVGLMIASLIQGSINSKLTSLAVDRSGGEEVLSTLCEVYMLHCQNAQIEKQFMKIMNLPVLLLNGWYFYMIVLAVYYMYTSTVLEVKRGFGLDDIAKYFNSVSFFLYLAVQLYYMMSIPSQYTERSKKMLPILGTLNHQCRERRMEKMLDLITLDYMQRDYDVRNCGMYEINRVLLFGTTATVTSYVIILVQFHLQEYG